MKVKPFKIFAAMLFLTIFFSKMVISVLPAILRCDSKVVSAVIMQLEHETKTEKDTTDKELGKEKKSFDEFYTSLVRPNIHVVEVNILHNQETLIYNNVYFPVVATPPPNA